MLMRALIQPLPGRNLVQWGMMRSRGGTLSHTERSEAFRESWTRLQKRTSPGSELYVEVRRL